jgi:hypothetical protein
MRHYLNIVPGIGFFFTGFSLFYAGFGKLTPDACNCYAFVGIVLGILMMIAGTVLIILFLNVRNINWKIIKNYIKSAETFAIKRSEEIQLEKSVRLNHIMEFNDFGFMVSNGLGVSKAFKEALIIERILSIFQLMYKVASNEIQGTNAREERDVVIEAYKKAASFLGESVFETLTKEISLDEFDERGFKNYKNFESLIKTEKEEKLENNKF